MYEITYIKYKDEYFECIETENYFKLLTGKKEQTINKNVEFEYIEIVDEDVFDDVVESFIQYKLIGKAAILDEIEENDNMGEIVNDIRAHVDTLPGLCGKYDKIDIEEAIKDSDVFDSYYTRYYNKCVGLALSGCSEDGEGNRYDYEGNIVEYEFGDEYYFL